MDDDEALVRKSQDGDLEAFGALVTRHEARVEALVRGVLGTFATPKDVEETAMDVFTRAWRDLRICDHQSFPDWLGRLTVATARHRQIPSQDALDTLQWRERVIMRLYFSRCSPPEEIAQLIGCSVGDVWARLHDGCRHIG